MKKRWAILTFILLICLNLITLGLLWKDRLQPELPPPGFNNTLTPHFLQNELQLSGDQLKRFGEFRRNHFEHRRELAIEIHELRRNLAKMMLNDGASPEDIQRQAIRLGEMYSERELLMFGHFAEMKALLTPEQREKFSLIIEEALVSAGGSRQEMRGGQHGRRRWQRRGMENPPE